MYGSAKVALTVFVQLLCRTIQQTFTYTTQNGFLLITNTRTVEEAKKRSEHSIKLVDVDRFIFGRKSILEKSVMPRFSPPKKTDDSSSDSIRKVEITTKDDECWYVSVDARRILKISTCDLAHLRQSGQIEYKKVGRAFLYRVRPNGSF